MEIRTYPEMPGQEFLQGSLTNPAFCEAIRETPRGTMTVQLEPGQALDLAAPQSRGELLELVRAMGPQGLRQADYRGLAKHPLATPRLMKMLWIAADRLEGEHQADAEDRILAFPEYAEAKNRMSGKMAVHQRRMHIVESEACSLELVGWILKRHAGEESVENLLLQNPNI